MVAKYLFVTTFWNGLIFFSSVSESRKNSWKDRRPTLATESRDVSANADTARLIRVNTREWGKPITERKFAIAPAKICGWVVSPCAAASPCPKDATAINAMIASILSISIAPNETGSMFFSFLICLEAVPEDTREWKPETAPQAIVTNKIGNMYCPSTLKLVNAWRLHAGFAANTPITAPTIMKISR